MPNQHSYKIDEKSLSPSFPEIYKKRLQDNDLSGQTCRDFLLCIKGKGADELADLQALFQQLTLSQKLALFNIHFDLNDIFDNYTTITYPSGNAIQIASEYAQHSPKVYAFLVAKKKECELEKNALDEKNKLTEQYCQKLLSAAEQCKKQQLENILAEMKKDNIAIDINTVKNSRGETLLMLAASGTRETEYPKPKGMPNAKFSAFTDTKPVDTDQKADETVALLLNLRADPLIASNDGRTPLMQAANFGHAGVVHQLIAAVPADKQMAYILQVDDTGKLSAREYAGQLGHYYSVRHHIHEELDKELDRLTPKSLTQKSNFG